MMSYKILHYSNDGKLLFTEDYKYRELSRAIRRVMRLKHKCELWFYVDDKKYRLVRRNFSEVEE